MASKKSNEARITIWTDTIKSEMSGSIAAVVIDSFHYILGGKSKTPAEMRELALKLMTEQHEKMKEDGR